MRMALLLLAAASLAGCASGRYMVISSPLNGQAVVELTLPSANGCAAMVAAEPLRNMACRDHPAPANAYRATLRDGSIDMLFDVSTPTLDQCTMAVYRAMQISRHIEQVAACKAKA